MDCPFDCSQFVIAKRCVTGLDNSEVCRRLSEIWGMGVRAKKQIDTVKVKYVQSYSQTSSELFEFEDQEFMGEFEEWQNVTQVPKRVAQFKNCVSKLAEFGYDVEKIVIVNTPTDKPDRIYRVTEKSLVNALYCMSLFYTGKEAGCETLIFTLEKNEIKISE